MTEGSLKLNETARISRSYTEIISTLPWHQSVTAFCQWTTFRGSYEALRSSVCSMMTLRGHSDRWVEGVSSCRSCKHLGNRRLAALLHVVSQHSFDLRFLSALALTTVSAACASTGAVPRPFPEPGSSPPSSSRGAPDRATAPDAYALTGTALALRGSPYRDGGSDPET